MRRRRPRRQTVILVATFVAVMVLSALASYFLFGRPSATPSPSSPLSPTVTRSDADAGSVAAVTPAQQTVAASSPAPAPAADAREPSITEEIFGTTNGAPPVEERAGNWAALMRTVTERISLAALLAALLAFRPRKYSILFKRNPFVAQTQILLAVVASALMMIVGDSAARAFGIFAAASLVRFRTNIRDPKEITVLLICLAIGLGTGVGRWELALILTVFALPLLWVLEYYEPSQVSRTMELKVKTSSVDGTQHILRDIFKKYDLGAEVRVLDREKEAEESGCIVYYVEMGPLINTGQLSEEIFSTDPQNVRGIEWDQKKKPSFIYQ